MKETRLQYNPPSSLLILLFRVAVYFKHTSHKDHSTLFEYPKQAARFSTRPK